MKTKRDQWPREKRLNAVVRSFLDEHKDSPSDAALLVCHMSLHLMDQALDLLSDPDAKIRETGCLIFAEAEYVKQIDLAPDSRFLQGVHLIERLLAEDKKYSVRSAAATALGKIGFVPTSTALVAAANDRSASVRFSVAFALGSYYSVDWETEGAPYRAAVIDALLRLMDDPDDDVRDWATFGIHQGEHDTPETRARLWKAIDDPNGDVRGEAVDGLAKFGDRTLIPRLDDLLRSDEVLSPLYFAAAEEFQDPSLLPAVLVSAERWEKTLEEGETLHSSIAAAIQSLTNCAQGIPNER